MAPLLMAALKLLKRRPIFLLPLLLCLAGFFLMLRALFIHEVHLDVPSLCHINRQVPSLSHSLSSNSSFSILTFADPQALNGIANHNPSLLESRSIYASLHHYTLRTYFHQPDARRKLVWSKVTAIYEILFAELPVGPQAASDEWVWVLDLDALIFNFNVKLESIVEDAAAVKPRVDFIIACDHNGMNAGSFLVRKSEWSRGFLKRWWLRNETNVPKIDSFFEQAALVDLIKSDKSIASHVLVVPIRTLNSYGYPSENVYRFQTGDFIVHCPGPTLKKWLAAYGREWQRMMNECKLREMWMDAGVPFESAHAL